MRKITLLTLFLILFLMGCSKSENLPQNGDKSAKEYFKNSYNTNIKNVKVDFINYEDFSKLRQQTNNFIILASSLQCQYCEELVPNFFELANEFSIKQIYFIKFNELDQKEKNKIAESFTESILPTVLFVKNGNFDEYQGKFDITDLSQKFEDFIKE